MTESQQIEQYREFKRELSIVSPDIFRALYGTAGPHVSARQEQIERHARREKRRKQLAQRLIEHRIADKAWSKNWKHPKDAYPLIPINPGPEDYGIKLGRQGPFGQLDISLTDLYQTAKYLLRQEGNQDAAATLRVIGPLPARFAKRRITQMPVMAAA